MTPIELQRKIEAKIADLNVAKLIFEPASEVHGMMIQRLFDEGEGAQGKLGNYSTEPNYFTKSQFKKTGAFRGKGKTGETKKKNGEPYKSMYLEDGYKELREIQGYESGFVNLQYSKDLRNDFSTGLKIKGDTVVAVVKRGINDKKVGWLSEKYGDKTFKLTDSEKKFFAKEVGKALANYFNN